MADMVAVVGGRLALRVYWLLLRVLSRAVPDPMEVDRMVEALDGKEAGGR